MNIHDIYNTPLVIVSEIADVVPYPIYQKLEYTLPSGSHYDRAYLPTVLQLQADGLIRPGDELRDISSGSAGSSLAMVGAALGYHVRITVPDELPEARLNTMNYYNAEVVRSGPGYVHQASHYQRSEILALAKDQAWQRLRSTDKDMRAIIFSNKITGARICYVNHSENTLTPVSFRAIGHEIVSQMVEPPAAIALAIGNWTTIAGISPVVRSAWPDVKLIGYESPTSDRFENYGTTSRASVGTDVPVRFRDESLLDDIRLVGNDSRDAMHQRVNVKRNTKHQIGRSSLMGLVVAEQATSELNGSVVTIAYDNMSRY